MTEFQKLTTNPIKALCSVSKIGPSWVDCSKSWGSHTIKGFVLRSGVYPFIEKYILQPLVKRGLARNVNDLLEQFGRSQSRCGKIWKVVKKPDFDYPMFGPEITSKLISSHTSRPRILL